MTTLAQKIKETLTAPYTGLLDAIPREQKQIVKMMRQPVTMSTE